ncbi:MAG: hypothetical protein WKF30_02425 [Pyrinomonadaceae bacterium]
MSAVVDTLVPLLKILALRCPRPSPHARRFELKAAAPHQPAALGRLSKR